MRSSLRLMLIAGLLGAGPSSARTRNNQNGVFEIASLGADRRVEVWLSGEAFTAYRVLNPEFEGQRYKLEHLFIGKRSGSKIKGTLWVREEGMPDFEKLRAFVGSVESDDRLMLDGLPIDRQAEQLTREPPSLKPNKRRRRPMPKTSGTDSLRERHKRLYRGARRSLVLVSTVQIATHQEPLAGFPARRPESRCPDVSRR